MKKHYLPVAVFTAILLGQCSTKNPDDLKGTWRADSIYSFYNGFDFTSKDVHAFPLLHFEPEGRLRMTLDKESRYFRYEIPHPDTLTYKTQDGVIMEKNIILNVDQTQLVLKKELSPVFKGKNQYRYEVKYFSRVNE